MPLYTCFLYTNFFFFFSGLGTSETWEMFWISVLLSSRLSFRPSVFSFPPPVYGHYYTYILVVTTHSLLPDLGVTV